MPVFSTLEQARLVRSRLLRRLVAHPSRRGDLGHSPSPWRCAIFALSLCWTKVSLACLRERAYSAQEVDSTLILVGGWHFRPATTSRAQPIPTSAPSFASRVPRCVSITSLLMAPTGGLRLAQSRDSGLRRRWAIRYRGALARSWREGRFQFGSSSVSYRFHIRYTSVTHAGPARPLAGSFGGVPGGASPGQGSWFLGDWFGGR